MELFGAKLQFEAAMNYYKGVPASGYERDHVRALMLFEEAANAGLVEAMFKAGKMYYSGEGTQTNKKVAFDWFLKAANKNHMRAQKMCASMYLMGDGIDSNESKALFWYEKAANQDDVESMARCGSLYHKKCDYEKAIEWYKKAIIIGDSDSLKGIGDVYSELAILDDHDMKLVDSTQDFSDLAEHWYKKAIVLYEEEAMFGSWRAMVCLGEMYLEGKGIETNIQKAKEYFSKVAYQKNARPNGDCSVYWQNRATKKLEAIK